MNLERLLDYCIYSDTTDQFCSQKSLKLNGFCDNHQHHLNQIKTFIEKETKLCVKIIKIHLDNNSNETLRINKAKEVIKLFDFLCKHKTFVHNQPGFKNIVLNKLYEFEEDKDIIDIDKYLSELFPLIFNENKNNNDNVIYDDNKIIICI